jgi:hypothetical protein
MRAIPGFLSRLALLRLALLRRALLRHGTRTARLWPVRRRELESVDHLADSVAVGDPSLVDVFDEIPNVGKRRGMSKVCREVSILAREVHRVRRASPGTDSGRVGFGRVVRCREVRLFGFRLHREKYRAQFSGWHAACDMVLCRTGGQHSGDDPEHLAFFADRVGTLDRMAIRESVVDRFSAKRMADGYEEVYVRAIERTRAR